jgi:hypothetical protein
MAAIHCLASIRSNVSVLISCEEFEDLKKKIEGYKHSGKR